jgi:hypothetical protein
MPRGTGTRKSLAVRDIRSFHYAKRRAVERTHPILGSKAPLAADPRRTPSVNPEFTRPRNRPLLFALDSCKTILMETVVMPAAPSPLVARPSTKLANPDAAAVMAAPMARVMHAVNIQVRREKIRHRRPAIGAKLAIGIYHLMNNNPT